MMRISTDRQVHGCIHPTGLSERRYYAVCTSAAGCTSSIQRRGRRATTVAAAGRGAPAFSAGVSASAKRPPCAGHGSAAAETERTAARAVAAKSEVVADRRCAGVRRRARRILVYRQRRAGASAVCMHALYDIGWTRSAAEGCGAGPATHPHSVSAMPNIRLLRDLKARHVVKSSEVLRRAYLYVARNEGLPAQVRHQAQLQLNAFDKYARPATVKNRCHESGRGRGIISEFALSRVCTPAGEQSARRYADGVTVPLPPRSPPQRAPRCQEGVVVNSRIASHILYPLYSTIRPSRPRPCAPHRRRIPPNRCEFAEGPMSSSVSSRSPRSRRHRFVTSSTGWSTSILHAGCEWTLRRAGRGSRHARVAHEPALADLPVRVREHVLAVHGRVVLELEHALGQVDLVCVRGQCASGLWLRASVPWKRIRWSLMLGIRMPSIARSVQSH
jgi:small subunit ribosomal protein S14